MPGAQPPGKKLVFSQRQHIKLGWEFEKVRQQGVRLVKGCLVLNYKAAKDRSFSRLGVITSRKIGNAVVRSRSRRLMREAFRLHQHDIGQPADLVLIARPSIAGKTFGQVERDYLWLLKEAKLLTTGSSSGDNQGGNRMQRERVRDND